jgi:hypothetical protein
MSDTVSERKNLLFRHGGAVPENAYTVIDHEGEVYLCNARCLCLWSMTLATRPGLPEENEDTVAKVG